MHAFEKIYHLKATPGGQMLGTVAASQVEAAVQCSAGDAPRLEFAACASSCYKKHLVQQATDSSIIYQATVQCCELHCKQCLYSSGASVAAHHPISSTHTDKTWQAVLLLAS
jgi:hypothetical protein